MPSADYSVQCTVAEDTFSVVAYNTARTANGFSIKIANSNDQRFDLDFSAAVHALNALPPQGGTGADAWASIDGSGTVDSSFNIASVTKSATGQYDLVFTTPMPTADYAITTAAGNGSSASVFILSKTTTGCQIGVFSDITQTYLDTDFNVVVHATNAQLPDTVTQEQIDAVLNNWTRTGTTLSPTNAGDDVDLGNIALNADGTATYSTPTSSSLQITYGVIDGNPQSIVQLNDNTGAAVSQLRPDQFWFGGTSSSPNIALNANGSASISDGLMVGSTVAPGSAFVLATSILTSSTGTAALRWDGNTGRVHYDTSSALVKENITECPYGTAEVMQLKPKQYNPIGSDRVEIGFIAEDVISVVPDVVPTGPKSLLTNNKEDTETVPVNVFYERMTAVLTKALQESITRIEALEAEVQALKDQSAP